MKFLPLAILVFCLISCDSTAPTQAKKLNILSRSITESDTTLNYRNQTTYPEIDSAAAAWEIALNERFLDHVQSDADSFRSFIQDFEPDFMRELEGTYRVHANSPQLLSVSQRFVWAVPGTPILLGEVKCTNYDREKQRFLELEDCLKAKEQKPQLLKTVQAEVEKQYGIQVCKEITMVDLAIFALEKAGMRFFIDGYGGNPACNQIEIVIPYENIKKIILLDIFKTGVIG